MEIDVVAAAAVDGHAAHAAEAHVEIAILRVDLDGAGAVQSQAQIVAVKSAHFGGANAAGGQLAQVGQRQLGAQFALVAEVDSVHFLGADMQRFAVLFDHHFLQCVRFAVDDQRGSRALLHLQADDAIEFDLDGTRIDAAVLADYIGGQRGGAPLPRTAASIAACINFSSCAPS
jgi:hypothetical protein